jgi:hypothetical protein
MYNGGAKAERELNHLSEHHKIEVKKHEVELSRRASAVVQHIGEGRWKSIKKAGKGSEQLQR